MIYQFKIHSTDRDMSAMGQVEAKDIVEATADALAAYKQAHPRLDIVHIEIEDTIVMPKRREQWAKGE